VPELGVTDDFFELGGDSLTAVRLMARVQRGLGVELPISALIEGRTVRKLARAIEAADRGAPPRALLTLNAGQPGRAPLFCVHPLGGNVLCYMPLARWLGAAQPCYGLQARGLAAGATPHSSVVEMAAAYAGEILAAQPEGPIHLAGWSFGGLVAVEVARQLASAGREVAPIVVIDTVAGMLWQVQPSEDDMLEAFALELFGIELDDAGYAELLSAGRDRAQRFERMLALARERGLLVDGGSAAQLEQVFGVIHGNLRAFYAYEQTRYHGEIVLLRCTDPMPDRLKRLHDLVGSSYADPTNGWARFCSRLQVVAVPGNHLSVVFEPQVRHVAAVMQRVLAGERARESTDSVGPTARHAGGLAVTGERT
jgi:thioesterase domain-containing protein